MTKPAELLIALVAFALAVAPAAAADSGDNGGRGLAELVQLAEEYDAGYLAARQDFAAAKEGADIAAGVLLPQADGSIDRFFADNKNRDTRSASAQLRQTFSLPNIESWRAARRSVAADDANVKAALQTLRTQVINGWLQVQLAADTMVLLSARKKTLQERQKRAEQLLSAGNGLKSDVQRAKARVFDVEAQLARARNDLTTARDVLFLLAGESPFVASLRDGAIFAPPLPVEEWHSKVAAGSLRRIAANETRAAAERTLAAAERAIYPQVEISAGVVSDDNKLRHYSGRFGLHLRQNLFTGGRISAQKRRLLAVLRAASARLVAVRREEEQMTKQRIGAIWADIAEMRALTAAAAASEEALASVEIGYRAGARTIEEVLSGEEELFDARLQLQRAQYNYLGNLAQLHQLAGSMDEKFILHIAGFFQKKQTKEGTKE